MQCIYYFILFNTINIDKFYFDLIPNSMLKGKRLLYSNYFIQNNIKCKLMNMGFIWHMAKKINILNVSEPDSFECINKLVNSIFLLGLVEENTILATLETLPLKRSQVTIKF